VSERLGSYAFLSWLRTGVSTGIARVDGSGPAAARAEVAIGLQLSSGPAGLSLGLYGPGDVTGLDPRVVIRTWPRPGVVDAEANYFPLVEFAQADLPWRYTPARATPEDRLRPWLGLVVLTDDEIERDTPASAGRPLPSVVVKEAASLPDLAQAWAWAHVQVSGVTAIDPGQAAALLAGEPSRALSRLLCPRRLRDRARYRALVVPTFERGRLAGLGEAVPGDLDGLTLAWQHDTRNVELPIYYSWRFESGPAGDFEALVHLLRARPLPATVGIRDMNVSDPGSDLPGAATRPLGLEGALKTPVTQSTPWPSTERTSWTAALRALLNRAAELLRGAPERPLVGPPLYGRWHAARDTLEPAEEPLWFQELNADPRLRAMAGLGTLVVQDQQRPLMASAWQQVEAIRRLNDELRRSQLAREIALRLMARHVRTADAEGTLQLTAPVHGLIRGSPLTIRALLRQGAIADGTLQGQFRRVTRPLGPMGRRQGRADAPVVSTILARMNSGVLSPAPPPSAPGTLVTPQRGGAPAVPAWATAERVATIGRLPAGVLTLTGMAGRVADASRRLALRDGTLSPDLVTSAPVPATFEPAEHDIGAEGEPTPRGPAAGERPEAVRVAAVRRFQDAAADLIQNQDVPLPAPPRVPVDLAALHTTVLAALDPRTTVGASLRQRIQLAPGVRWQPEDPLEPIMAAPAFEQPMYKPLAELSQDWILPGLDGVPPNTVSLLLTNQRVIEAYMVGLNHEMSRELLWHEYPTDMRGTYFRQFWDVSGYLPRPGESLDPETLKDVRPIHAWPKSASLGMNTSRRPPPGGEHLVLLVRGELLRRYPNSTVYAVRAKLGALGQRELDTEELHPVFSGALKPDVAFFGFELSVEEARGVEQAGGPQGWFFVIQEQPSEPRFGLDVDGAAGQPVASWDALSWKSLVPTDAALSDLGHIDLTAALPDTTAAESAPPHAAWHAGPTGAGRGSRASDLAFITLQRPVRIAWHASDMLPG
jgi:hypothetical protein